MSIYTLSEVSEIDLPTRPPCHKKSEISKPPLPPLVRKNQKVADSLHPLVADIICERPLHHATSPKLYWSYYPHRSRDSLSPVCRIFYKKVELFVGGQGSEINGFTPSSLYIGRGTQPN